MDRTVSRYTRAYISGFDASGNTRSIGPLSIEHEVAEFAALSWQIKGGLLDKPAITVGDLNGIFDTTAATGLHALAKAWPGVYKNVMIAIGMGAEPALGDWAFLARVGALSYKQAEEGAAVVANVGFGQHENNSMTYALPWSHILHAWGVETAVNTGTGLDNVADSHLGGYMMYHVFAGNGTPTIKVQDSADDINYADLAPASLTSGALTSIPASGVIEIGHAATIRQYTRWQVVLGGGCTSVTFALALVRGR